MIIIKNNYFIYIENLNHIDLNKLKSNKKINIIYRNFNNSLNKIIKFRSECKKKKFKFFIANDIKTAIKCKCDGLYISAYNKKKYHQKFNKIGSAHNLREINQKIKQGCKTIIISRLFKTKYVNKKTYLGVLKFNFLSAKKNIKIIALGGINNKNLLSLNNVKCDGFAIMSEIKKKPAVFINRLF